MKYLLSSVVILLCLVSYGQNTLVYFEKNSYNLDRETMAILDSLSDLIHSKEIFSDILLTGHTDTDASNEYNQTLSLNRVRSVQQYFISSGIRNRFHLISIGEKQNINSNLNEDQMALNRRVEIKLDYQTNRSVFNQFSQQTQIFRISPFEETRITTSGGVQLVFGKEIFEDVKEHLSVRINIQEFYDKEDFILANLTTSTLTNQLLESGGMINIVPTQGDDTLRLKSGASFQILFPDRQIADDMQLFQGLDHGGDKLWDQTTFNPSRSFQNASWTKTFYPSLTDKQREHYQNEFIDGDTIRRSRTWYETINGKAFELTEIIDVTGTHTDTVPANNQQLLGELFQTSTTLGWINCDRFYDTRSPKETLYVQFDGDFIPTVSIVIDDINSILRYSYRENDVLVFTGVPINMNITIIGLHQDEYSGETLFAKRKSKTRKNFKESIYFHPTTAENIKNSLATME